MLKCKVLIVCLLSALNVLSQSQSNAAKNRKAPQGITFKVDAVEKATVPLKVMTAQNAFEFQLGKKISFFPDDLKNTTVVPTWNNAFIAAIHISFDEHRPLSLSPDAIWLTICQGVSIHINQNFDQLEALIFKADKPDKFQVRNDDLPNGSAPWADLLHSFSDSTTKYVNDDYYAFFVPEFSTTTDIITTSYEITMLEGFSQAFQYFGDTGCGIPTITLQGKKEDWQAILNRLDKIEELGLVAWATELRWMMNKFIDSYSGKVDLDFWQSIYKNHLKYGPSNVSGWFIKLFPYLCSTGEIEDVEDSEGMFYSRAPRTYVPNPYMHGDDYLMSDLESGDFPTGISEITVHWNDNGTEREMTVHAGFYGINQYADLTLEPAISWAVRDVSGEDVDHDYEWADVETEHRKHYWSPDPMEQLVDVAIYNPEAFSSPEESYASAIEEIVASIESSTYYLREKLEGKTIEILISSKGTVLSCSGTDIDPGLMKVVEQTVLLLSKKWKPATADYRNFIYDMYDPEDIGEIYAIPCNSLVKLMF